jgi:hypothetical protein
MAVITGGHMHDNARPERRRVFGFPEFIPTVEAEYPRFFEIGPRVLTAMHSVADREYTAPEPHQRAILNLAMVAGISLVEVVVLAVNGLAHGSMKVCRSLMETAINVEYLRLLPATFEDYREWVHVERYRKVEFVRVHLPDIFRTIDAEAITSITREMNRVRSRFEHVRPDGTRRLRSSWSAQNLAERAAVGGFSETYKTINPLASSFVHETMSGLLEHFEVTHDIHRIEVPPTLAWSTQALSGAHDCMVRVVKTLSETFGVPSEPPVDTLAREWHYAWTEPR